MGMSIGSATQVGGAGQWQQQRQTMGQLSQALKSGDLSAAQQAFSTLSSNSNQAIDPNSPLGKVGAALQSGDVSAAQSAFSAMRAGHHHHHAEQASASTSTSASASPALASSGSVGTQVNTVA